MKIITRFIMLLSTIAVTVIVPVSYAETHHVLPFWGQQAREQGYELPETYGIGASHMNQRQDLLVEHIKFNNLSFGALALPSSLFDIGVGHTRQKSHTENLRLDAWVLPFFNLYGVIGKTKGHSLSQIEVDSDPTKHSGFLNIISQVIHGMNQSGQLKDLEFRLDFKGKTYGGGFTLAGGYENYFALVDTNYTWTKFDVLDGNIKTFTVTPRLGYRFTTPGINAINLKPGKLNLWVGSMYQNIQQNFKGSLSDLTMPSELQGLIGIADANGLGRFDVKQRLESPWNALVGARYEITPNIALVSEVGFAKRNSFFISGEYRF